MVSVFGTMCADVVARRFGVPYAVSASGFAVVLAIIFTAWNRTERTLSIHSITTTRRELFYWATITVTFALGTAVGDMTATTFDFGLSDLGDRLRRGLLLAADWILGVSIELGRHVLDRLHPDSTPRRIVR